MPNSIRMLTLLSCFCSRQRAGVSIFLSMKKYRAIKNERESVGRPMKERVADGEKALQLTWQAMIEPTKTPVL